jgi:hypothetical protein
MNDSQQHHEDILSEHDDDSAFPIPIGTLVFGLVVMALGLIFLIGLFYDITFSAGAIAISLVVGAGVLLIVGGLGAGRRNRQPETGPAPHD